MSIYLSASQYAIYLDELDQLGKKYEEEKFDKTVVHKFKGSAYVDSDIHVKFVNGLPQNAMYNNVDLGVVHVHSGNNQNNKDDYCFEMSYQQQKKFNKFLQSNPNFTLRVSHVSDGLVDASVFKAYDDMGNKLKDFTDYNM